jgi:hypothetical protein
VLRRSLSPSQLTIHNLQSTIYSSKLLWGLSFSVVLIPRKVLEQKESLLHVTYLESPRINDPDSRRRWEDGIRMDLREIGLGGVDWIRLAQDRGRWRVVMSAVMNLRVLAPRSSVLV